MRPLSRAYSSAASWNDDDATPCVRLPSEWLFAIAWKSASFFAGDDALTVTTSGNVPSRLIGWKSLIGSYESVPYRPGLTVSAPLEATKIV